MPYQIMCRTYVYLIVAGIIMTYGCARTPQAKFYILQPSAVEQAKPSVSVNDMIIGVGPVDLAEYLNRPQIVTRVSNSEIHLSEFNQYDETDGD